MVPQPVKAVLMLFPITDATEAAKDSEEAKLKESGQEVSSDLWFSKQTISNACGTVAMLHAFANGDLKFQPGSFLEQYFKASEGLSPIERAHLLEKPQEGQPDIAQAHKSAAQEGQTAPPPEDERVPSLPTIALFILVRYKLRAVAAAHAQGQGTVPLQLHTLLRLLQ